jgi:nucleotide-binding universal stress UspA family protein
MAKDKKRIMVGINAHYTSDMVLSVAKEHARAFDATLFLFCSVAGHSLSTTGSTTSEGTEARVTRLQESLEAEGIPYETHIVARGESAGADLVNFAIQHDVDEIVLGFKQRSAIGEMVFGSNYRYVIAKARCPVVTVHDWH